MGKSPGKWIKTLLFGKKSARSNGTKGRNSLKSKNDKGQIDGKIPPASAVDSPEISEPVTLSSGCNGAIQPTDLGTHSNETSIAAVTSPKKDGPQGVTGSLSSDASCLSEEQAAIKAQAAFRGYLARRAFRALKGIIRLQALGRGHLVRRQAVATLHAMDGILKLQTIIRGRRVGHSNSSLEVGPDSGQAKLMEHKTFDAFKKKFLTNLFTSKLLSSSILATALQVQYAEGEPNSVLSWLDRWSATSFWKSLPQPKKTSDSKIQIRTNNYAIETESGKSKCNIRMNSSANNDFTQINATTDSEKAKHALRKLSSSAVEEAKHALRKLSSSAVDSEQEHPQSELEKVKRNLRKISKMMEASEQTKVEIEKNDQSFRRVVNALSDIPDQVLEEPEEQMPNNIVLFPDLDIEKETVSKYLEEEEPVNLLTEEQPSNGLQPLQQIENEQNTQALNRYQSPEDEKGLHHVNKNKRRSSFSAKSEYTENGTPNAPVLPSYMAATKSAKAKLRGQNSPRMVSDSDEKNGFGRRHSLPSTNVKLSSNSPRTQRVTQANGRDGTRSDKSLFSSRDRNERAVQVEWRR